MTEAATVGEATADRKPRRKAGPKSPARRKIIAGTIEHLVRTNPDITVQEIADTADISRQSASAYLAKYGINKAELDSFVENRNAIVKSKQKIVLDALTTEKASKSSFKDLAIAYGILLDKDRLETGESTSNVASWTTVIQQSQSRTVDVTPSGNGG